MSFLGSKELEEILPTCIDKYSKDRIDNVAYELCLGDEVYLTDSANGKKERLDEKNSQVVIKPGQFALLLTQETLTLPTNILGFISIKFSQKIKGLVNISGFHVDPGFHGKIIFSVYNAGPATIVLDKGQPYFLLWFSQLSSNSSSYSGKHKNQQAISGEQISALNGELASPNSLLKKINDLESKLQYATWIGGLIVAGLISFMLKGALEYSNKDNEVKPEITNLKVDSIASVKVDSILRIKRLGNDTTAR